jgi:hypothetical protein
VPNVDQRAETETPSLAKPYGVEEFAEKHRISLKPAEVILIANGPSRHKLDIGAGAFPADLEEHRRRKYRSKNTELKTDTSIESTSLE